MIVNSNNIRSTPYGVYSIVNSQSIWSNVVYEGQPLRISPCMCTEYRGSPTHWSFWLSLIWNKISVLRRSAPELWKGRVHRPRMWNLWRLSTEEKREKKLVASKLSKLGSWRGIFEGFGVISIDFGPRSVIGPTSLRRTTLAWPLGAVIVSLWLKPFPPPHQQHPHTQPGFSAPPPVTRLTSDG